MFSNKIDSSIDMNVVSEWRKRYLERSAIDAKFYHCGDNAITVGLPIELIEFSNASAGHSGYNSGARPTGIRYAVDNPAKALAEIFESDESFARFISGSDKSGPAYCAEKYEEYKRNNGIITVDPLDRPMSEFNIEALYGKGMIMTLRNKFPKTVMNDYRTLTRGEFEARYELVAVEAVAV